MCKRPLDNVIATTMNNTLSYEDYQIWGADQLPGFVYDQKSRMFFPPDYYKNTVETIWVCSCTICKVVKRDVKTLRMHMISSHNLHMCELCIDHKHVFPYEQKVYQQCDYENHLRKGDNDGSEGHPSCEFCKKRYYDKTALFQHLQKDHFTCHICDEQGIKYKYYIDYRSLESHFRKDHFICEEESCLAKKFVVFANEIEHASHTINYHPHLSNKYRSINLQFSLKKNKSSNELKDTESNYSSGRGSHFEGGTGGRAYNGEWQVELEQSNVRDPRENNTNDNNVNVNTNINYLESDFPSLPTSTPSANLSTKSHKGKKESKEDFPELGPPSLKFPFPANAKIKIDKRLSKKPSSNNNSNTNLNHSNPQKANATDFKSSIDPKYTVQEVKVINPSSVSEEATNTKSEPLTLAEKIRKNQNASKLTAFNYKANVNSNYVFKESDFSVDLSTSVNNVKLENKDDKIEEVKPPSNINIASTSNKQKSKKPSQSSSGLARALASVSGPSTPAAPKSIVGVISNNNNSNSNSNKFKVISNYESDSIANIQKELRNKNKNNTTKSAIVVDNNNDNGIFDNILKKNLSSTSVNELTNTDVKPIQPPPGFEDAIKDEMIKDSFGNWVKIGGSSNNGSSKLISNKINSNLSNDDYPALPTPPPPPPSVHSNKDKNYASKAENNTSIKSNNSSNSQKNNKKSIKKDLQSLAFL